jgi:hypothetical protein
VCVAALCVCVCVCVCVCDLFCLNITSLIMYYYGPAIVTYLYIANVFEIFKMFLRLFDRQTKKLELQCSYVIYKYSAKLHNYLHNCFILWWSLRFCCPGNLGEFILTNVRVGGGGGKFNDNECVAGRETHTQFSVLLPASLVRTE